MASVLPLPQLSSTNYSNWRFRVETLLEKEGVKSVIDVVEESVNQMTNEQKEAYKMKDTKAKCIIVQCISDKHLEYIKDAKSAGGMLRSLKNVFERRSIFSKLYIMKKLLKLKCMSDDLQEHFMQVETLLRELVATGATLDESDKACYLLLTMPEKYDTVITAIETVGTDITLEFVKSRLLDAELKFKDSQSGDESSKNCAFTTGKYPNSRKCFRCGEHGHFYRNCPKNSKEREKSGNITNRGHRGRGKRYSRGYRKEANMACGSEQCGEHDEISFVALSCNNKVFNDTTFILDSGASENLVKGTLENKMTDVSMLEKKVFIKIANGDVMVAEKKGKLQVKCQGMKINIEALIVNGLNQNLLSVSKLTSKGYPHLS